MTSYNGEYNLNNSIKLSKIEKRDETGQNSLWLISVHHLDIVPTGESANEPDHAAVAVYISNKDIISLDSAVVEISKAQQNSVKGIKDDLIVEDDVLLCFLVILGKVILLYEKMFSFSMQSSLQIIVCLSHSQQIKLNIKLNLG